MMPPKCTETQAAFSAYLDGAVNGHEMRAIAEHLDTCKDCAREFSAWRSMQSTLAALKPAKPPVDLGLKLRLAISREHARHALTLHDRISLKWENAVRPILFQFSAGLASAVALVGTIAFLLGTVAVPEAVLANDEPLGALTTPHYLYSAAHPSPIVTPQDTTIVVEANINDQGRVYDYNIVSGPQDSDVRLQVNNQLLLSVFEPARVFGAPVRGRVVLTFAGISVHG